MHTNQTSSDFCCKISKYYPFNQIYLPKKMKKFLFITCLVLTALMSTMAAGLRRPIFLTKQPTQVVNPLPGKPGTQPLSVTEDDVFFTLSAEQTAAAILLTASSSCEAMVTIESEDGSILYCQQVILTDQPLEILTEGWIEGSYLIYIEIEDELYEGEFEL